MFVSTQAQTRFQYQWLIIPNLKQIPASMLGNLKLFYINYSLHLASINDYLVNQIQTWKRLKMQAATSRTTLPCEWRVLQGLHQNWKWNWMLDCVLIHPCNKLLWLESYRKILIKFSTSVTPLRIGATNSLLVFHLQGIKYSLISQQLLFSKLCFIKLCTA